MEMIIFDNFQSKPHLNNSALVFNQTVCFDSLERSYSTCKMYRQRRKCSMETCHRSSMAPVQTEGQMMMIKVRHIDCKLYACAKRAQSDVMEGIYCKKQ